MQRSKAGAQYNFFAYMAQKEGENVAKQYRTIEFSDRKEIAALYGDGMRAADIAARIGFSTNTIYTELRRGHDGKTMDKFFRPAYDPDLAQKRVQEGLRRRGRKKEGDST